MRPCHSFVTFTARATSALILQYMFTRSAILLGLLLSSTVQGDVLVNLDATTLPTGPLTTWSNTGTLGGTFDREIDTPSVTTVAGVKAVTLDGAGDWYVGPATPVGVTGNGARSVEVWVFNPALSDEEAMVAWGRRGGGDATNMSFNYGGNAIFGAVGHWGPPDMGWNTSPVANSWHHLVYTYDGTTARVYQNGVQKNAKGVGLNTWATANNGNPLRFLIGTQNEANGTRVASGRDGSMSIAKVRIHNTVLAATSVENTYLAEGPAFAKGQPIIKSFASNAGGTVPAGTPVVLSWNVAGATSVSINGAPPISGASGTVIVSPSATTIYTLTGTNATGSSTQNVTVTVAPFVPPALTRRYSFNEGSGTQVLDSIGGFHGTILGSGFTRSASAVSLPGGASGTSAYIDLPNGIVSTLTNCTIEGWVAVGERQFWSRIFDFGNTTSGEITGPGGTFTGVGYLMLSAQVGDDNGIQRVELLPAGQTASNGNGVFATVPYAQTHFAVVYSATGNNGGPQLKYYREGALLATVNTPYALSSVQDVNSWLGRSNYSPDGNLEAAYNELRVWNGALSATDILESMNTGPDTVPTGPYINSFFAVPSTIYDGESTTLYWSATNQQGTFTAEISPAPGAVAGTSGNVTIAPAGTGQFTYTFAGTNALGTRRAQTIVTVLSGAPVPPRPG